MTTLILRMKPKVVQCEFIYCEIYCCVLSKLCVCSLSTTYTYMLCNIIGFLTF